MNRLITIPISHYCEKARWALDRAEIPYVEERHLQGFHIVPAYLAGKVDTVPVLVTSDGVLCESTDILKWVDTKSGAAKKLYPINPRDRRAVEELAASFDRSLGPAGRLWMYSYMLDETALILRYSKMHRVPPYQTMLLPIVSKMMKKFIGDSMDMNSESRANAQREVDHCFQEVGELLQDGRRFLMGDRFSAADLTFAALAAAVLIPDQYGVRLPQLDEMPPEMKSEILRWRAHPAGAFALRLFREYRFPSCAP